VAVLVHITNVAEMVVVQVQVHGVVKTVRCSAYQFSHDVSFFGFLQVIDETVQLK